MESPIFNKILNILIWESWGFESLYKNKIHSFLQSLIVVWFVFVTYAESQPTYQDFILFSSQQCAQICKDFSTKDVIFTSVFFLMFLLNCCESIPWESWKINWKYCNFQLNLPINNTKLSINLVSSSFKMSYFSEMLLESSLCRSVLAIQRKTAWCNFLSYLAGVQNNKAIESWRNQKIVEVKVVFAVVNQLKQLQRKPRNIRNN